MGSDTRRIILATALSIAVIILWTKFFAPPATPPPAPAPGTPSSGQATQGAPQAGAPAGAAAPAPAPAPMPSPAPAPSAPEELVVLDSPDFEVALTSHGGAVKHVVLKGEKYRHEQDGKTLQIDLVRVAEGQPYPFAVVPSPELGGAQDVGSDPAARAPMRIAAKDERSVTFEGAAGSVRVRKTYRLTGKPYELALDLDVAAPRDGNLGLVYPSFMPPQTKSGGFFSGPPIEFLRPICRAGDKTERFKVDGDAQVQKLDGAVGWAGVDQHYFVSAVFPPEPAGTCVFSKGPVPGSSVTSVLVPLAAGEKKATYLLYAGPKNLDTLRAYDRGFDSAIDYGMVANLFSLFARVLLYVMRWFASIAHNWGVAIILLTVLVKGLLYPLTAKSMASMNEMRKLAPEIEKLKAKYGQDRERLNQETMKLYQQHKVNPLGGCLPMLLQLPVWFALYAALQTSVELYREPFLWMKDLTQHDPFFILPIAMGISSFVMQKLSPQPADNAQAKMMLYFMPGFFTILMLFVPGGLTLYIFVNNLLSIVQQQVMMRRQPAPVPAKG